MRRTGVDRPVRMVTSIFLEGLGFFVCDDMPGVRGLIMIGYALDWRRANLHGPDLGDSALDDRTRLVLEVKNFPIPAEKECLGAHATDGQLA